MSGGGESSRVPIPNNVRKTIHDIREITGKQHSDDEIYGVLKECSMDPNETAQKLLYLDTFHEVRRRRDRKKEVLSGRGFDDSSSKQGGQGRGGRGAFGSYSSNFPDGSGGRNVANRKEIGINHITERSHAPSTQLTSQKTKNNGESQVKRVSAVAPNSPANQSNGSASHDFTSQSFMGSVMSASKRRSAHDDTSKQEKAQSQADVPALSPQSQTYSSATRIDQGKSMSSSDQIPISASSLPSVHPSSDSVLAPSISQNSGVRGAINGEVENLLLADELNHVNGNKAVLHEVGELPASKSEVSDSLNLINKKKTPNNSNGVEENQLSDSLNLINKKKTPNNLNGVEENQLSETEHPSFSSYYDSVRSSSSCHSQASPEVSTSEVCVQSLDELKQSVVVTFPNHFQVPEALKSGLKFGSFGSDFDKRDGFSRTDGDNNASPALHSSQGSDKTATSSQGSDKTATSSNQSASSTAVGDHPDYTHSSSDLIEKPPVSEVNAISATEPEGDQPKQEVLLAPVGTPIPAVLNAQNYGLNFMSTMLGTQQVQFKGAESQPQENRPPNFVNANSHAVSSPSPTPPLQSSIPVSPQSVSIFRPPYPTNFFPYGHYYPPVYVSPIHQYLSHNGFPQQPTAGNMYLPAAAAGIKFPLQQFKAGANTGNTAHIGIPPGSFISPPVGYAPTTTVNAGNSTGNEDLAVSQLKENHILTTGQMSEGSAVWIPAPGQDISSLQLNPLYNFTPQGHLTFPTTQAGHAFAGIYQSGQTVASPSTLLQQSQAVAGAVETVGLPSGAYQQQPQHPQMNWNSKF